LLKYLVWNRMGRNCWMEHNLNLVLSLMQDCRFCKLKGKTPLMTYRLSRNFCDAWLCQLRAVSVSLERTQNVRYERGFERYMRACEFAASSCSLFFEQTILKSTQLLGLNKDAHITSDRKKSACKFCLVVAHVKRQLTSHYIENTLHLSDISNVCFFNGMKVRCNPLGLEAFQFWFPKSSSDYMSKNRF